MNKEILILVTIFLILFLIYVILGSMYDFKPFFVKRKFIQYPNNIIITNLDEITNFGLSNITIDIISIGTTPEIGRRHFYKYDYYLEYDDNKSILKEGTYKFFNQNIISGDNFNIIIPLPIVNVFPETSFKLTLKRTIVYSNLNVGASTASILDTNEYISNIISTTTLVDSVPITSDTFYYNDIY